MLGWLGSRVVACWTQAQKGRRVQIAVTTLSGISNVNSLSDDDALWALSFDDCKRDMCPSALSTRVKNNKFCVFFVFHFSKRQCLLDRLQGGGAWAGRQEAQLSPRDRAMRRVSWNLANCHAAVQKLKNDDDRTHRFKKKLFLRFFYFGHVFKRFFNFPNVFAIFKKTLAKFRALAGIWNSMGS